MMQSGLQADTRSVANTMDIIMKSGTANIIHIRPGLQDAVRHICAVYSAVNDEVAGELSPATRREAKCAYRDVKAILYLVTTQRIAHQHDKHSERTLGYIQDRLVGCVGTAEAFKRGEVGVGAAALEALIKANSALRIARELETTPETCTLNAFYSK